MRYVMIILFRRNAGSAKTASLRTVSAADVFEEEPATPCQPAALCGDEAEGTLPARQQT